MPRFLLHASAAALAFAAPAFASESVAKAQVLDAIRTFEANATGGPAALKSAEQASDAVARASNTILKFALESDDVVVDLGTDSVPWCDLKKGVAGLPHSGERGLMLAAYLSGSVKAQLLSAKHDPNPYAGWIAMLRAYRAVRIREGVQIPEIEALLARQMDGSLQTYAAAALERSNESLRKAYGPVGPPRQTAPALASQP